MNDGHGNVHQAVLTVPAALIGAFLRVVVDEVSVFEIDPVLLQIGLSLRLIPDERGLIVATI